MDKPQPNASHQQLQRLAGQWHGDEKMHPSPWDPKGGTSQASMNNRLGVNGFALIGDYEQSRNGTVCFTGHAVHTIDPKTGEYLMHWFDCMGQGVDLFRGRMEGDRLVVSQEGPQGFMRMTYVFESPDRITSKMEMSQDGKNWSPLFDAVYTKSR